MNPSSGSCDLPWLASADRAIRCTLAILILVTGYVNIRGPTKKFIKECEEIAPHMGHPSIVFKSQQGLITDYLDGYKWMKDNTPEDARVMAWWDYGYQITGISNRTSIADGNTWNHEHIATLGRAVLSPNWARNPNVETVAGNRFAQLRDFRVEDQDLIPLVRHLADYVLVWAGGHGDDMGKSPHLAARRWASAPVVG
eukprot:Skav228589  [mRNA]  locus=scaffold1470:218864:222653:- [translate_table: standard]